MPTMSDKFAEEIISIAIAQIANDPSFGGFNNIEGHALHTMVSVVGKYIESIGKQTRSWAEHGGRTESNVSDILQAFESMPGSSIDWKELERMCKECQVVPLSGVPDFPVERRKKRREYGKESTDTIALPGYIPGHLPSFPDAHCYLNTCIPAISREKNPQIIVDKHLEDVRQTKEALAKINSSTGVLSTKPFGEHVDQSKSTVQKTASVPSAFL